MTAAAPWPVELRLQADKKALHVAYDTGERYVLPAEYLRVESPSAEVQGHSPSERKTVPGKQNITIIGVEPVGNYAVRLRFDDMHDSGIFSWDYLLTLGREHGQRFADYEAALAAQGLSRAPRPASP